MAHDQRNVALVFLLGYAHWTRRNDQLGGAVLALRAACFNRRTCLRWPLDNRLGLVLLVLFAILINSYLEAGW